MNRKNENKYRKTLTHPYIFELVWYLSLTESNKPSLIHYPYVFFVIFNRKDILQVIYESSKTPEGIKCQNDIFEILKRCLKQSIEQGNYQITDHLTQIGIQLDFKNPENPIFLDDIFQIKDEDKKNRFLNYLYHNKAEISTGDFDHYAFSGYYKSIEWLVEHGYQGYTALHVLENENTQSSNHQRVLVYLRGLGANSKWKADDSSEISRIKYLDWLKRYDRITEDEQRVLDYLRAHSELESDDSSEISNRDFEWYNALNSLDKLYSDRRITKDEERVYYYLLELSDNLNSRGVYKGDTKPF